MFAVPVIAVVLLILGAFFWWWSTHTFVRTPKPAPAPAGPSPTETPVPAETRTAGKQKRKNEQRGHLGGYDYLTFTTTQRESGQSQTLRTVQMHRPWSSPVSVTLTRASRVDDARIRTALRDLPDYVQSVAVEKDLVTAQWPVAQGTDEKAVEQVLDSLVAVTDWSLTLPPDADEVVDLSHADPSRPHASYPDIADTPTGPEAPEIAEPEPTPAIVKPQRMAPERFGDADVTTAASHVGEDQVEPIADGAPEPPKYSDFQGTRAIRKQQPPNIF